MKAARVGPTTTEEKEKKGVVIARSCRPLGRGRSAGAQREEEEEEEGAHLLHSRKFLRKKGKRRDAPRKS